VVFARRWRCSEDTAGAWRLTVCDARQTIWCARKVFYIALGDVHDAMLWLGAQLRVLLVLG